MVTMSHSWMEEFEQRLQQLERSVASTQSDLSEALSFAIKAIGCLSENPITEFWIVQPESIHRVVDGVMHLLAPTLADPFGQLADSPAQWVDRSLTPLFTDGKSTDSQDVLICRYPLAQSQQIIIGTSGSPFHGSRPEIEDAALAVTTIFASRVTQHLLSATTKSAGAFDALLQFAAKLQTCDDERSIQQVIAQESGVIWPQCRIATMGFHAGKHRISSITGAGQINHQSAQVQAIESLASFIVRDETHKRSAPVAEQTTGEIKWIALDSLDESVQQSENNAELRQLIADYQTAGVVHVGTVVIHCDQIHVSTVLLESSRTELPLSSATSQWNNLIQAAMTRSRRSKRTRNNWRRHSWPITIGILSLLTAVSFFVPMDFELTANGQLVARGRRSVFAPESGTVTKVHFRNEQKVNLAAPLITLVNPELVQRASELDGEVATTKAAIAAVNARRTSRAAEGSAAEGQVLKQRLKSLEIERNLFNERIESLLIRAPFQGHVVRRDAAHDLTDRPLQRGQKIAELIPLNVSWELELHIPQSHSAYLQTAFAQQENGLPVRYIINSESNTTYPATLKSIEQFTYNRNGQLVQNAAVEVQLSDSSNAKSGTSVSARISCGRRSLGFIATRRIIETLQHLKFVWWN